MSIQTTAVSNLPPSGRYEFKPLPHRHSFRLLRLFPPRADGDIECSLLIKEFNFDKSPISYEAISYVWGDPTERVNITCEGKSLSITASLHSALRRVRLSHRSRILWADGICINQNDPREKSRQVELMRLIYLRARRVLAWIGPDDGEAERAARLIKRLRTVFEDALEGKNDLYLCEVMNDSDQAELEVVVRMFERPLFNRVWIIQEIGVASDITFLYGGSEIDRIDLLYFVNCMVGSQDLYQLEYYTDYARFYYLYAAFRPDFLEHDEPPDFLELLHLAQNYEASDARDHVFALLGHPDAIVGDSSIIWPDYTKSVGQIYTQLMFRLLQINKNLRPLSIIHHDELIIDEELPSWVPALHKPSYTNPFGINKTYYYNAGSAVTDMTRLGNDLDGILTVRGFVFDTLRSHSSMFPENGDATDPDKVKAFREAFALSQSQVTYEDGKRLEAFGLTMVAGLIEYTEAEKEIAQHRANFSAYFIRLYDMEPNGEWNLPLARDSKLLGDIRNDAINGIECHFTRDADVAWNSRRFFCTSRGYFGLGPKLLMEGDLCCVLFGAKVPFVLRKVDNYYILVGECYIHGIMRGEAIDMWRNGKLQVQVQEFELH